MILYPPKVSSERVVDDVGTNRNKRRHGSKVTILWLTCLNEYKGTTFGKGVFRSGQTGQNKACQA